MNQSQGGNGGGKKWVKHSNNKGHDIKSQNQQQINKKYNGYSKSKNGVHIVGGKWMCLCNKGCRFNTSATTGLHDTWSACVKNNQPLTLSDNYVFQNIMIASISTVTQVVSNHGVVTQYPPPINGGTSPALVVSLHHIGDATLISQYSVQKYYVCEHHKNAVPYPEFS